MDVTNAFMQEDLDEEIYMLLPQGFQSQGEYTKGIRSEWEINKLCSLKMSLYGLKQTSRQ